MIVQDTGLQLDDFEFISPSRPLSTHPLKSLINTDTITPPSPHRPDALILIGMLVALRLAVYYTLRVKTRTRKLLMAS